MPRGRIGGATAALIEALAERGCHVSAYQIERWRATGELPRPVRRGRGRGRGTVSEPPGAETVNRAVVLAQLSRQGSRRPGSHPIERFAAGLPVPENVIREAIETALEGVARMFGAHWQARQDIAARLPDTGPLSWQELVDAFGGGPQPSDPPRARMRAAFAGMIHALGGGSEASGGDLIEMFGLHPDVSEEHQKQMRLSLRDAELNGDDVWDRMAEQMSMGNLRRVAATIDLKTWQRALGAITLATAFQAMIVLIGGLHLAGKPVAMDAHFSIDGATVRRLEADPMWPEASRVQCSFKLKHRPRELVFHALIAVAAGNLERWEAYRDRLVALIYPDSEEPTCRSPLRASPSTAA